MRSRTSRDALEGLTLTSWPASADRPGLSVLQPAQDLEPAEGQLVPLHQDRVDPGGHGRVREQQRELRRTAAGKFTIAP